MSQIYISIGSNIDREKHINNALNALERHFDNLIVSSVYESEAVGFEGDDFYNLVAGATTDMPVAEVVDCLKRIENENGRVRNTAKFSARTLDLDLLTYDQLIIEQPAQLPRDEINKNAFVLWPLAEIAPNTTMPGSEQTYEQMWQAYDKSKQKLWTVEFNRK